MRPQSGFTLIEVVATAVISTILAGVILTLLHAGSDQAVEILSRQKAMSMYNVVSEQIGWTARQAYWVKQPGDGTACPGTPAGVYTGLDGLILYDRLCTEIGRYEIATVDGRHRLMERRLGVVKPFIVAGDTVFITPFSLDFGHTVSRRAITFALQIQYVVGSETREYRTPEETIYLRGGN